VVKDDQQGVDEEEREEANTPLPKETFPAFRPSLPFVFKATSRPPQKESDESEEKSEVKKENPPI
jgi:hypothetical protein